VTTDTAIHDISVDDNPWMFVAQEILIYDPIPQNHAWTYVSWAEQWWDRIQNHAYKAFFWKWC